MTFRVPKRFQKATMATLREPPYKDRFYFIEEYAQKLGTNMKNGSGLLLSGQEGTGKTWAMYALTRYAYDRCKLKGVPFDYEFVTAATMFDRISIAGGEEEIDSRRGVRWVHVYCTVPWLVINDLGKEYRGGALHDQVCYKLGRVVRERSERQLTTHITSNLALKGEGNFKSVYGASITSLLREMVTSYHIQGEDMRGKKVSKKR